MPRKKETKLKLYLRRKKIFKEVKDLAELYDYNYYHGMAYEDYSFEKLKQGFFAKMKSVKKFHEGRGRLLDLGCALGFFVKIAQDEGFDAYGIDFSEYAIDEARKLVDDHAFCLDVEKGIPFESNYFDVVTAWDFLEHLNRPDLFLKEVNRVLKGKGLIFITTLNYKSLLSRMMRENWVFIDPVHLTHTITTADLTNWLKSAGFRELVISTAMLALESFSDRINSKIVKKIAIIIEKTLRFQVSIILKLLRPLNLGDLLICVARKER